MRQLTIVVGLLAAVALAGCKKQEEVVDKPVEAPAVAPPAPMPTPPPPAAEPPAAAASTDGCPSAVPGATTTVADGKDTVEVTIVGKDKAATDEIRSRSMKLAAVAATDATGCPVVLANTTVGYAEVEGGAKLIVKPTKPEELKVLSAESKRRNDAMPKAEPAAVPAEAPARTEPPPEKALPATQKHPAPEPEPHMAPKPGAAPPG